MSYLRKAFSMLAIRTVSAGVGFAVELKLLVDFKMIEVSLILLTAVFLIVTVYSHRFKRIFPYWLIVKSGFDFIYIITLSKTDFTTGLIIASNIIFIMVYVSECLIDNVLKNDIHSKFASITFAVCFLIPYIVVFLSLGLVLLSVFVCEMSLFVLLVCLLVNACVFFKVCLVYINLLLLTMNK